MTNALHTEPASATSEWLRGLNQLVERGVKVAPRDLGTRELLHQTFHVDLRYPVVMNHIRKLNFAFMAAEAYWILTGDDTVAGIAPYNSHIAQFSDDGMKFAGAYGPRVKSQLSWVVDKLHVDNHTRQAGLIIWKDMPAPSRDVPCTVAIWFTVRDRKLNAHVFMRSSDIWLGLPYDIFSFSMLAWLVTSKLNALAHPLDDTVLPGTLHLTAVSSHLYDTNFEKAEAVLADHEATHTHAGRLPREVPWQLAVEAPEVLLGLLKDLREDKTKRWW